jgi:ribonuclease Y
VVSALMLIVLGIAAAVAGVALGRLVARRRAEVRSASLMQLLSAIRASSTTEATEIRRGASLMAREEAEMAGAALDAVAQVRESELSTRDAQLEARRKTIERLTAEVSQRRQRMDVTRAAEKAREDERRRMSAEVATLDRQRLVVLEERAGASRVSLRSAIIETEVETARVAGVQLVRALDQSGSDPDQIRRAKRVMGIAVGRFSGHYLTERLLSTVPIPAGLSLTQLAGPDESNLRAIEAVANVKLTPTESGDAVRLEGLDGVGREVVRRTLTWMGRNTRAAADAAVIARSAREISSALDRELMDLGRRAFAALEIPRAHDEIVSLVGRLNYRTSFTQNQWKHAVEAAFLCGMMADELDLDIKVARRAALMHDIGKALTHAMDGSHAVIGADYARRLGESEIVANAIGAHHTDEPFSSPYAYLVAAADAMSGARPGARRQMEDNYVARLDDLERITRGFRGVEEAYAVQGGREVRIYVAEDQIDDRAAIGMSSEIAAKISAEMTFPGQIRVTVIREMRAIEVAN